MKNLFSSLCFSLLISTNTYRPSDDLQKKQIIRSKSITLTYKGFYAPVASYNSNQLIFTIQNNTNDTLNLSLDNIKVEVSKNGHIINEDLLPKTGNLFPPDFLTDDDIVLTTDRSAINYHMTSEEKKDSKKLIDSLKKRFAKKLYDKNAIEKKQISKSFFYSIVISRSVVLLPQEKTKLSQIFVSAAMNNSCTVNAKYNNSNIFTSFEDKSGNKIDVRN